MVSLLSLPGFSRLSSTITIRVLNRLLIAITLFFLTPAFSAGQGLNFSRLNTSNGLSDNRVRCVVTDKNGFLWAGTNDGLNVYDGYTNTVFTRDKYPEMAADMVIHLLNDSRNRIWIGTYAGANWIDENRHFHPIVLRDSITRFYCPTIVETATYGVVLQTDLGHYYFDSVANKWKEMDWMPTFLSKGTLMDAEPFSADKIIFTMDTLVALYDYKTRRVEYKQTFVLPLTACRVSDTSIAIGLQTGRVMIVNTFNQRIIADHQLTNILKGKTINTYLTEVRRAANGDLIVATDFAGLIIIDKNGNISRHTHDPLRPGSISGNNTYRSFAGPKGEVLVGTYTSGVNMANIYNKPAGYTRIFADAKGNLYDNYITRIVEDTGSVFWLGANDRLIRWNKRTGQSAFYSYDIPAPGGMRPLEIWALAQDKRGRLWVSAQRDGLSWFNKQTGSFHKIKVDTTLGREVATPVINEMHTMSDGSIWVGTNYGLYSFDPVSMKITTYSKHPLLKDIQKKRVINFYEDTEKRIWFSAWGKGAWCYDPVRQKLDHFSTKEGLAADVIYGFAEDNDGRIYIGTTHGFSILEEKNGKWIVQTLNRSNGLRYERCEALLKDTAGDIWITNNKSLIRYSPVTRSMTTYEENSGLSIAGFRANTSLITSNGEMMWGSESGVNYFFPGQIVVAASQLQVSLYAIDAREFTHFFSHNQYFSFPFSRNDITFHFTAINLNGSHNILYQYKLEGYDKEWHTGTDVREARYTSLPAGDYTFHVKASIDGSHWTEANNKVTLNIVPPVWRRWWFIALVVLAVSLMVHAAYWMRLRQIKEKEKIKAEYNQKIAEIEMKALRAQMNPHFIFNCLNSINRYIVKSDNATASLYLTRFSKLIRLILDNSNSKNVLLSNEMEALKIYIEMEALRFNNKFTYNIHLENGVCPELLEVPPLIIQPYVENAIWHGLLHKETGGHLTINLRLVEETLLQCVIEDDGVGRNRAKEYKSKSATTNKSLGMKLTEDRISILNKHASLNASIQIIDLIADNGEPAGTRVILNIPV